MNNTEKFRTVKEVALWLRVSTAKIYELVEQRKIPCFRIDGTIRFRESELKEWLERKRLGDLSQEFPRSSDGKD